MFLIINNPIFHREFLAMARAWKTRLLVCGYLLALAALLYLLWPSGGIHSVVTENSREIYSMFFGANLLFLLLLAPAFTSGAISQERENETYQALFGTLLKPFDIMVGKLCASIFMLLILTILSLPIASLCALTGGLDLNSLLRIGIVLFTAAVTYGMVGLACSAVCSRTSSAILLTYGFLLFLTGATWLPNALLSNLVPMLNTLWQSIETISPFDALAFLLYPDRYRMMMTTDLKSLNLNPYTLYLIFSFLISWFSFSIFYKNIRRPPQQSRIRKGTIYTDNAMFIKRKLTFPFYLLDPLRRKKPIGILQNPVFVAEMRSKLFSNTQFVLRSISAILIISIVLMTLVSVQFTEQLNADAVRVAAIIFQLGIVALLAPGVSSSLITEEITCGTFQALRMTPLSPLTVIAGKLKATFFYALIFIASGLIVFIAMTYLQIQDVSDELSFFSGKFYTSFFRNVITSEWRAQFAAVYTSLFAWVAILLLTTLTCLCAGLFASTIAKNTSSATAMSYGFTGVFCVATLLPIPLSGKLAHNFAEGILSFNPFISAIQVSSSMFREYPNLWKMNLTSMAILIFFFLLASFLRVWYLFQKRN